ncbi:hypothetical protein Bca52824_044181 [Brassica carinata]|uniref:Uncharacterized protein n=1 Tax=Brassica carinata TaxID=52824 RepID=A0A8X7V0D4_BRACI|nr:hypothetical protein Bca52824_044181 [Brassica carinata]
MGSHSTPQLPVIYLSDQTLKPGSEKWVEVRSDVRKALEDYGAFEVSYDRVSEELKESVLEAMKELFQLPVEAKRRNVSPKPYTGYMTHNGISESLGIQDANVLEKVNEFTQLLYALIVRVTRVPGQNFCLENSERIHKFSEKLAELDVMVRMVFESFGIEDYYDENLKSMNYRLRLMKYTAPRDVDTNVAAGANDAGDGANTNNNGNTVLYQHEIEGLEVLTKDEKWIRLKPSHNSFVVIAGDSLYDCSRLQMEIMEIIEPPKELVDEQHPRVFKPLTYVDLMSFYHTEVGRRARSTLHAYCAVSGA